VAPELGASLSTLALLHPRCRVHLIHDRGVVSEDLLLSRAYVRAGHVARPVAIALLEGRARVTAFGRHAWMSPGDVVVAAARGAIRMRQEGEPYRAVELEWDADWLGDARAHLSRIDGRDAHADLLVSWQRACDGGDPAEVTVAIIGRLVRAGLAARTPRASELRGEDESRLQQLAHGLDDTLSDLAAQPMLTDLEARFGTSTRQLHRWIGEYNERYGFDAVGWGDTRSQLRLSVGAKLLTSPRASVKRVARLVGYRDTPAFTRALQDAGLPPPSQIAAAVDAIGRRTAACDSEIFPFELRASLGHGGEWAELSYGLTGCCRPRPCTDEPCTIDGKESTMATRAEIARTEEQQKRARAHAARKKAKHDALAARNKRTESHESDHAGRKATHALETHLDGARPSRKSTRKGANRLRADAAMNARDEAGESAPKSQHALAAVRTKKVRGRR
jgi:AraC-like DNA-binding protein